MQRTKTQIAFMTLLVTIFISGQLFAQAPAIRPADLGWPMPNFTLPSYQGGEVSIAGFKGKNILLVFPRGYSDDKHDWCQICHYEYADLVDVENTIKIRDKYNLEIVFVLPYDQETVKDWVSKFPEQMEVIEGWKNPPNQDKLDEPIKRWMLRARILLPKKFDITKDNIPTPFPILIDADRTVSKGLGLFTTEWGGAKVEQNIPAAYLIDTEGNLKYKYISQRTTDRPNAEYLMKILERIVLTK